MERLVRRLGTVFFFSMLFFFLMQFELLANENDFLYYTFKKQWYLVNHGQFSESVPGMDIGIKNVWTKLRSGKKEIVVAVIDTGVDIYHEDLKGVFWENKGEIPKNGIDDDDNGFIDDIHGWNFFDENNVLYKNEYDKHSTHITGVIAARWNEEGIFGIVGDAKVKIMVLKVLGGKTESGTTDNIAAAIRYAEQNGAMICNLSFGTPKTDRNLRDAILYSKMLFVTASGNGDKYTPRKDIGKDPIYPASYSYNNVLTVANLTPYGSLNPLSNYGAKEVHLAAPGTKIYSTIDWSTYRIKDKEEAYDYMSGTSMAAPMVTSVAALIASTYPDLSVTEIREAIIKGVKPLSSLKGLVSSGGMLSAEGAVQYIEDVILKRKRNLLNEAEIPQIQVEDKGYPPVIKILRKKKRKFQFSFYDPDKDIAKIRYSEGKKNARFFQKGRKGTSVYYNQKNGEGLRLKKGKTYTIYVIDKKGNEALKVIRVK